MKKTVTVYDFIEAFQKIRPDNFTLDGLRALFAHLEELESCMGGEELELDPIAFCQDFSEYSNAMEAAADLGFECEDEEDAYKRVESETVVIPFQGGIIIENW
jgi:hypothetical protein